MTYTDLKTNVLLRMGEDKNINEGVITVTSSIAGYLKAIPDLLREGLNILATAGKYVVKHIEIEQTVAVEGMVRHDLQSLATDFYSLREVYFDDGEVNAIASNYRLEGDKYFTVDGAELGTWRVYYNAYPQVISSTIADDVELVLDHEVYAILPLYIEGKLRLIADEDYATIISSEFEQRRAELMGRNPSKVTAKVVYEDWGGF